MPAKCLDRTNFTLEGEYAVLEEKMNQQRTRTGSAFDFILTQLVAVSFAH